MSLQVIGAGLPRTGTLSMKAALERLGFGRCYHMEEVFADPPKSDAWARFFGGETVDWDDVFAGYGAAVDAPACMAWRELAAKYPDAKVVLTVRNPDAWYASMSNTILSDGYMENLIASSIGPMIERMAARMMGPVGPRPADAPPGPPPKEAMLAMREAHQAAVAAEIPAERLLVFNVAEGWGPLCRFLDKPVPDEPFPRVNDSASFHTNFPVPRPAVDA